MFNNERFDFKILSVLRICFPKSERFSPARSYHALIVRIHGKAEVVKGDDRIRLTKNDVTFVPKGYEYNINTITDEEVIVVHFHASFSETPSISSIHSTYPDTFVSLFEKLLFTWQNQPCGYVYKMDALFLSILEQIERQMAETQADSITFRIQRTVDIMHSSFSNPALSVDSLAAEAGYCSSYFRRIFHNEMGISPKEYLTDIRIRHAIALLESGYYSVERVSELSGFSGAKYFSTVFKRTTGKTPSSYMAHQRQNSAKKKNSESLTF